MIFTLANFYWMLAQEARGATASNYENKAIQYYKQAVDKFPNYLRAHKNLGQLYVQKDETDKALSHLIKSLELGNNEARTYGVIGYIYYNKGRYVSSETAIRNALSLDPDNESYRILLGQTLSEQERYAEAYSLFSEILLDDPNNTDIWLAQFNALMGMDKIDEAATNLEIVRNMGKADPEQLMLLGNIYVNKGMLDMATSTFLDALERSRAAGDKDSLVNAAKTLTSYGSFDNAIRLMDAIDSNFQGRLDEQQEIDLKTMRSRIAIARGEGAKAAQILEDILSQDPLNGDALITLGQYYSEMVATEEGGEAPRNKEQAIFYFERAEEHPEDDIRVSAYLQHGQLMVKLKRFSEAVNLIEKAQAINKQEHVETYLRQVREAAKAQGARG